MRKLISYILILIILSQIVIKTVIYLDYFFNKEYIAQNFCVNKDKPKLHCEGKCHLNKQLEEQEKKEPLSSTLLKEKYELQVFQQNIISFTCLNSITFYSPVFPDLMGILHSFHFDIFHPPQQA